jgi:hypothetical protein
MRQQLRSTSRPASPSTAGRRGRGMPCPREGEGGGRDEGAEALRCVFPLPRTWCARAWCLVCCVMTRSMAKGTRLPWSTERRHAGCIGDARSWELMKMKKMKKNKKEKIKMTPQGRGKACRSASLQHAATRGCSYAPPSFGITAPLQLGILRLHRSAASIPQSSVTLQERPALSLSRRYLSYECQSLPLLV